MLLKWKICKLHLVIGATPENPRNWFATPRFGSTSTEANAEAAAASRQANGVCGSNFRSEENKDFKTVSFNQSLSYTRSTNTIF